MMREAAFVKQNKEKWMAFENALQNKNQISPDQLANDYIHLTNDLAYAQTYYPNSKTLLYLNSLASRAHQDIYKNKKEEGNRILDFYRVEFPMFMAKHLRTLLYTFLIFTVSMIIGALSSRHDEDFVRLIMGDAYVNMTIDNIQNGDPMGVYASSNQLAMFLGITINNIRVAILAFVLGIFFSVGTVYVLFSNGVMLGAFIMFFHKYGEGFMFHKTVWLHGATEISVIVIAGCAGMIMGNSLLFPKTYSRKLSFVRGAKDGLKVLVATMPFFVLAGFIEGFITRYSNMPAFLAFSIIFGTLGLVIWYFVIYPLQLNKQYAR